MLDEVGGITMPEEHGLEDLLDTGVVPMFGKDVRWVVGTTDMVEPNDLGGNGKASAME